MGRGQWALRACVTSDSVVVLRGYVARQRETFAHLADDDGWDIHCLELTHTLGNPRHAFLSVEVVAGNFSYKTTALMRKGQAP